MLNVKNLVLQFGSLTKPLSFEVEQGTTLWLRGENGVGKSTLLLTIAGIINAKSGTVESTHGAYSYAPQKPNFAFGLKTKRVLELAGIDSTSSLITRLGIDSFLNTPVTELSGGEAQRAQIAIALSQRANLILLDEPFASQDVEAIKRIKELITEAKADGKVFIVASHIAIDAEQVLLLS